MKKGDKVRVKKFDANSMGILNGFNPNMKRYCGKVMEVVDVNLEFELVFLKEPHTGEGTNWVWKAEWLEPVLDKLEDFDAFLDNMIDSKKDNSNIALKDLLNSIGVSPSEYKSILTEAESILSGERNTDYGDPVKNFKRIANIASLISGQELSPEICAIVMMAVKLSREQYKHKRDNLVDLVAYIEIYNRIINSKN